MRRPLNGANPNKEYKDVHRNTRTKRFITVMSENHMVLSTWKKMFGSFLPQMTKGDLDVFNDYYHDGWGHMYIACQLTFGGAETIGQALKNLMYSIEKARGYNRNLVPSSMLTEMEHYLANRPEWTNELEPWMVTNIYARPLEDWMESEQVVEIA